MLRARSIRKTLSPLPPLLLLLIFGQVQAHANPITFESLSDGDLVTTQVPGLTFSNTIALTAGISLNEFDFPPHSGKNVVSDEGGPISILFDTPVSSFSAYFTYLVPLSLEAFDLTGSSVDLATSLFSQNDRSTGDPGSSPNELLRVVFAGGISRVVITGFSDGGSFVMDDVNAGEIPEPSTGLLLLTGAAGILLRRSNKKRNT
ncbi:MAG: PEP-CTERM sorting domain-containing protein [Bryobacteraceae bacterium]|nr:PEP-CTERM sorting domain-containing protein [Bryobacteraceae bacterium]